MKTAIIYFSKFGNNKNISEKLAEMLREGGGEADVYSAADKLPGDLNADLFVFSSPTRMGNPPGKIKKTVRKIIPKAGAGFAVINSCGGADQTKVPAVLGELAEGRGLKQTAEALLLTVTGMQGPLEEGYETKLKEFADKLLSFKAE